MAGDADLDPVLVAGETHEPGEPGDECVFANVGMIDRGFDDHDMPERDQLFKRVRAQAGIAGQPKRDLYLSPVGLSSGPPQPQLAGHKIQGL